MKTIFALIILLLSLGLAHAETGTSTTYKSNGSAHSTNKPKPPPGFEPIPGRQKVAERVNANVLVTVSYCSVFGLIIAYLLFLWRERRRINTELVQLSTQIAALEPKE